MTVGQLLIFLLWGIVIDAIMYFIKRERKLSFIEECLFPIVILLIISGISTSLAWNLSVPYFVILFYFLIEYIRCRYLLQQGTNFDLKHFALIALITSLGAYGTDQFFIQEVQSVFPDAEQFKNMIWFFVAIFLFMTLRDRIHLPKRSEVKENIREEEGILLLYTKLKHKYSSIITNRIGEDFFKKLIYAILVYEVSTNPLLIRKYRVLVGKIQAKAVPMGIMQVKTKKKITDEQSIEMVITKLEKSYLKNSYGKKKPKEEVMLNDLLVDYDKEKGSLEKILRIYKVISNFEEK